MTDLNEQLVGVGVIVKRSKNEAMLVADVTKKGLEHVPYVICKTAKAAVPMKVKKISGLVSKDHLHVLRDAAKWSSELAREIPVTKLL